MIISRVPQRPENAVNHTIKKYRKLKQTKCHERDRDRDREKKETNKKKYPMNHCDALVCS